MKKTFTMALTVVVASAMLFITSCNKSDNPVTAGGDTTGGLTAAPTSVSLLVGGVSFVTISGGKVPYSLKSNSDTTKVRSVVSGTTLTVTGLAVGTATIVVKDSAGTSTVSVPVTVASMIATPNTVTVVKGATKTVTISGGTAPYTIQTAPTSTVATAAISGSTLSITGVGAGTTSVVVKDNSATAKTVSVDITVTATAPTGTSGTTSFNSDKGNFTATGIYDASATSGTGAGGFLSSTSGAGSLVIYAYRFNSATSLDLLIIQCMDTAPIATGTYTYPPTSSKSTFISYYPAGNPADSSANFYLLSTATSAVISAISSTNVQGTFSGNGMFYANSTPNPSNTIAVTGGTFNVPITAGSGGSARQANSKIESIVRKLVNSNKR